MALKKITDMHKQAMLLKVQGADFEEIGRQVNRNAGTVENWFWRDKTFMAEFDKFKKEFLNNLLETIKDRMQQASDEALSTLIDIMRTAQSEKVRLEACRDILDRVGFKPGQVLELTGRDGKDLEINVSLVNEDED